MLTLAFSLAAGAGAARAQQIAVPYYGSEAFVAALQARAQAPQSERFEGDARALGDAIAALCASPAASPRRTPVAQEQDDEQPGSERQLARQAWLAAADAWERLQAVSVGATIERRSAKSIDFRPARPALIKRAVGTHGRGKQPPDAKALERVGTPAKGLPALEWLLWDRTAPRTAQACRYAAGVAQAVHREAEALAQAHAADAAREWAEEPEAAAERAAEAVNQWLAGLEGLRWRNLGKPLATLASAKGKSTPDPRSDVWPRPASGSHREAWQARWESLRNVAIGPAPTDGFGPQPAVPPAVVSLEAMLRGRGRNVQADAWAKVVMAADQAMHVLTDVGGSAEPSGQETAALPPVAAQPPPPAAMQKAVESLDAVKQYLQDTVAPALEVTLGFPDADGD